MIIFSYRTALGSLKVERAESRSHQKESGKALILTTDMYAHSRFTQAERVLKENSPEKGGVQ
jgi:hypothetical protein